MSPRRDRYGEPVDDEPEQPAEHRCDRGWIEDTAGRVRRCPHCQPEPQRMTERQWQQRITDLATLRGWLVYHPLVSRGSAAGWPDLVLVRDGTLVVAELKTATGRVSKPQRMWLDALAACGVAVHVWRPADWPEIVDTLSAPRKIISKVKEAKRHTGHRGSSLGQLLDELDDVAPLAQALDELGSHEQAQHVMGLLDELDAGTRAALAGLCLDAGGEPGLRCQLPAGHAGMHRGDRPPGSYGPTDLRTVDWSP